MGGIINYKKLDKEFLEKAYQKAEQGYCESVKDLEIRKEIILKQLKASWSDCLGKLGNRYQLLQESGLAGKLCYGYLSRLRSGVLKQTDWYRMDYYDERGNISEIECGEDFHMTYVLQTFNQSVNEFNKLFTCHTRVKEYEADKVIYQMAERFCEKLEPMLLESFKQVLATEGSLRYGKQTVKFFMGEYFAQSKQVIFWNGCLQ